MKLLAGLDKRGGGVFMTSRNQYDAARSRAQNEPDSRKAAGSHRAAEREFRHVLPGLGDP